MGIQERKEREKERRRQQREELEDGRQLICGAQEDDEAVDREPGRSVSKDCRVSEESDDKCLCARVACLLRFRHE